MKKLWLVILPLIAAAFFWGLKQNVYKEKIEPNIDAELKEKASKDFIEQNIINAIKNREFEEAKSFIELSKMLKVSINPELEQTLEDETSGVKGYLHKSEDFFKGFFSGKANNGAELAGTITSDFTVVGDVRDIYKEGKHYINNEDYDKFTLSLSLIGLGLTGATVVSLGASAVPKAGVSILKAAKKSRALTKGFSKTVAKRLDKSVDLKVLKNIDFSSISSIKSSSKAFAKSINLKPIESLFKDLNKIKKNSSTVQTIKILKYVDNEKDLAKAIKVTNKYKKSSLAVFKTLGKGIFRGAKFVVKQTALYLPMLIGLIFTTIVWSLMFLKIVFSLGRRLF